MVRTKLIHCCIFSVDQHGEGVFLEVALVMIALVDDVEAAVME